jgi:hypothetical protein
MRPRKITAIAISAGVLALSFSTALADDCDAIDKAFEALSIQPTVSQTVAMSDMPPIQSVIIGDTFYAHDGTKWTKITLKPGGRTGMLRQFVPDATSLKECAAAGADTIDGRSMTTYTYIPPTPEGMEAFAPKDPRQKLWIGDADGLPYRMTAEGMEVNVSYGKVEPPIP